MIPNLCKQLDDCLKHAYKFFLCKQLDDCLKHAYKFFLLACVLKHHAFYQEPHVTPHLVQLLRFASGDCNNSYYNCYISLGNYRTEAFLPSFNSPQNALHDQLPENPGRWCIEYISRNSAVFWDKLCNWFTSTVN